MIGLNRQRETVDLAMRAILALLPDFLAQRQRKIHESREAHIRVKSLGTAQQMINCRVKSRTCDGPCIESHK
jgi:hypothetical protein